MRCLKAECARERSPTGNCPGCNLPLYCSADCLQRDAPDHSINCRADFRLQDFAAVPNQPRSEVRLVIHKATSTYFGLRTISKEFGAEHIVALKREVAIRKRLSHPNVVQLYGMFEDEDSVYLVQEHVTKSLPKGISERNAKSFFAQICHGVHYLHDHLIVNRDLRIETVAVSGEEAKISSFEWCAEGLAPRNTFCGRLEYRAPEMVLGSGHSFPVDIWALGVLLYELLHGVPPWTASNDSDKTEQILACDYACSPSLTADAKNLISSLLTLDPESRPSISQVFLHPWLQSSEDLKIGDTVSYYLKGFGLSNGLVTALDDRTCTLFFEANSSYQQLPTAKIKSLQQRKPKPDPVPAKPEALPRIQEEPLQDEDQLLAQIEQWCSQPSKVPVKASPFLRDLEESKRRLDESLAELQGGRKREELPRQADSRSAQREVLKELPMEVPDKAKTRPLHQSEAIKQLPSQATKPPVKLEKSLSSRNPEKSSARVVESRDSDEEDEAPSEVVVHHWRQPKAKVDTVLQNLQQRELAQKLALHEEELKRLEAELSSPTLPKVRRQPAPKEEGMMAWLGNFFK